MLQHAQIYPPSGPPIEVMFNPTMYGLDASVSLQEKPVIGHKDATQFSSSVARTLSMDLLFDTYEQGSDVREHTDRIYKLVEIDAKTRRPPIVTFAWGSLNLVCMLERVNGRFTLFLDSGIPARATLSVVFKEVADPKAKPQAPATGAGVHTTTHVLGRGDSLSSVAASAYGDPGAWRAIAAANGIDNPRALEPGQRIVIPPAVAREVPA